MAGFILRTASLVDSPALSASSRIFLSRCDPMPLFIMAETTVWKQEVDTVGNKMSSEELFALIFDEYSPFGPMQTPHRSNRDAVCRTHLIYYLGFLHRMCLCREAQGRARAAKSLFQSLEDVQQKRHPALLDAFVIYGGERGIIRTHLR